MQETRTIGPRSRTTGDTQNDQSLVALLALVGAKRMDVETLRGRTKLTPIAFDSLLDWLQKEHLIEVISALEGDRINGKVELTEKGEGVLLDMLERTCELPEVR